MLSCTVHVPPSADALIARLTDSAPPVVRVVCAWCPDFEPLHQPPGLSHGMCPTCIVKFETEIR